MKTVTTNSSMKTQVIEGESLHLNYNGTVWCLTIDPPNRSNGTQRYDGWFPRHYKKLSTAKAAVTIKMGREWEWEED